MLNYKIAVVGSGAVGSYYGGKLAYHGRDVHFLMRSDLPFVKKAGLTIRDRDKDFHIQKVNAHASTEEIGPCDLVLIAIKTTSNSELEKLIPPLLKPQTVLLTLQNGLGNEEFLARHFGEGRVMGGLCFICLNRVDHGVIEHYDTGTLSIGEFNRPPMARTNEIVADFNECDIAVCAVESLIHERWRKLVWNIPFNGLSIVAGKITVADILANEGLHQLARNLMSEVIGIANKKGYSIPLDFIEAQIQRSLEMGPYKPSSLVDYILGRGVEVEAIWGEACKQGLHVGAEIPRLEMLYQLLKKLNSHN